MNRLTREEIMAENLFRSDGHLNEEGVALCVDALSLERSGGLPLQIQSHLDECGYCKGEVMSLYDLRSDDEPVDGAGHPYFGRRKRLQMTLYRVAAAIVLTLAVSAIAVYVFRQQGLHVPDQAVPPPVLPTDSVSVPSDATDVYAARFVPSENLEGLVGGALRSASVDVKSPVVGERVGGQLRFEWMGGLGPEYSLEILTNTEEARFNVAVREQRYVLNEKLEPGLYYWKLIDGGELVYVGKFIVPPEVSN
jgi:hypothetical protein